MTVTICFKNRAEPLVITGISQENLRLVSQFNYENVRWTFYPASESRIYNINPSEVQFFALDYEKSLLEAPDDA